MGGVGKPRPPVYGKLRLCAAFGCGKKKGAQPYPAARKREAHGQSRSCADNTSCFGFGNGESPGAAHCVPDLSRPGGHHSDLLAGTLTPFRRQSRKTGAPSCYSVFSIVRHVAANCKREFALRRFFSCAVGQRLSPAPRSALTSPPDGWRRSRRCPATRRPPWRPRPAPASPRRRCCRQAPAPGSAAPHSRR